MNFSFRLLLCGLMGLSATGLHAQLSGNVSVEGEYEPIVIETERLNTFPAGYKFELPPASLEYEMNGIVSNFNPGLLTMGVTGRKNSWPWQKRRGYVDFNMGSYLNSRLDAGSILYADSLSTLEANLKFHSSSLFRIHGVGADFTRPARKRLYDGEIGFSYSRIMGDEGLLDARAAYRAAYFNYYGTTVPLSLLPAGENGIAIPTQTLQQAKAALDYSSSPSLIRGWHAEGAVTFTSYRRLWTAAPDFASMPGDKETDLKIGGGYAFNFADRNAIAVDASGKFLFYSNPDNLLPQLTRKDRDLGVISLRPSYRFENERLSLRAGFAMDFSYGPETEAGEKKFSTFHLAPDAEIQYNSGNGAGIFLSATGGVMPVTLAERERLDPYQTPWLVSQTPVYTPVDARLGVNVGPFEGFTASFSFRYAVTHNVPLGGWYQTYLGSAISERVDFSSSSFFSAANKNINLHGLSIDLDLNYRFGTMVEVDFSGCYTPQKGEKGIFNGFDRPRFILSTKGSVRPIKKLKIEVGYDYRGVRNCYWYSLNAENTPQLQAYRLSDITDLNAKIIYSLLPNLDIYCKGGNLLNSHTELLPGLQQEGITISGGLYFEF